MEGCLAEKEQEHERANYPQNSQMNDHIAMDGVFHRQRSLMALSCQLINLRKLMVVSLESHSLRRWRVFPSSHWSRRRFSSARLALEYSWKNLIRSCKDIDERGNRLSCTKLRFHRVCGSHLGYCRVRSLSMR